MFGLSIGHILVVAIVVLLFGARRIPELGSAAGKSIRAFKEGLGEIEPELKEASIAAPDKLSKKS